MSVFSAEYWNRFSKIGCCACVALILFGGVFAAYRWNYLRTAVTAKASIIELIEKTGEEGQRTTYSPVYVFADGQGQTFKVESSHGSNPPIGKVGDIIDVFYDPENPQHSIENSVGAKWGLSIVTIILGVIFLGIFGVIATLTGQHLNMQRQVAELTTENIRLRSQAAGTETS